MKMKLQQAAGGLWKDLWSYRFVVLGVLAYYLLMEAIFSAFCPSVVVTGFPCPGCGLTRAAMCVMTGQFVRAWKLNPTVYGVFAFVLYAGWQRYICNQKVKGFQKILLVLAITMIVIYIYRMCRYFPDRAPMSFTRGSLLEQLVPEYGRIVRKLIY